MSKETIFVNPLRRRTSSQVGLRELATYQQHETSNLSVFNNARTPETSVDQPTIPENVTRTRFRHSSFALSGERPDTLDELITAAACHATSAAATREVAVQEKTTMELLNSSSGGGALTEGQLCNVPTATLLTTSPSDKNTASGTSVMQAESSYRSSDPQIEHHSEALIKPVVEPVEHDVLWHNNSAFDTNPLKSELLKEYLARVSIDSSFRSPTSQHRRPVISTLSRPSSADYHNFVLATLPSAILSASSHSLPVAPISMPAHHFIGSAAVTTPVNHGLTPFLSVAKSCDEQFNHPLDAQRFGYQSDNGLLETATSQVKRLQLDASRRSQLGANYQRRSNFSSAVRKFPSIGSRTRGHRDLGPTDINHSTHRQGHFYLSHLYDGLSASRDTAVCRAASSTSKLYPPPPDFSRDSSAPSDEDCAGSSTPSSSRIRTLLRQIKPTASSAVESAALAVLDAGGDFTRGNDYIYMDEEAQERRTKAQVVNVITPVSF